MKRVITYDCILLHTIISNNIVPSIIETLVRHCRRKAALKQEDDGADIKCIKGREHETGLFECNSNKVFRVCFIFKRSNSVAASQSINHIDLPKGSNAFMLFSTGHL